MKVWIHITLKSGVLDTQGKATENALHALGFEGIRNVRQGKFIELELNQTDPNKALSQAEDMCQKLLANTVIENYKVELA